MPGKAFGKTLDNQVELVSCRHAGPWRGHGDACHVMDYLATRIRILRLLVVAVHAGLLRIIASLSILRVETGQALTDRDLHVR